MGKKEVFISIITVNYNGLAYTRELLDSLAKYVDSASVEVIVVDNGSSGNDADLIELEYGWVKVIRSNRNLGFAGGNNLGIKEASGKYLFFINNDTVVKDSSLLKLAERLESSPAIGGVSPKIRFFKYPDIIQYAGYTPLSCISLRNKGIGYMESETGQYDRACSTAFLHGAAMMLKREAIERAGLMPELFFLYYEEFDWCESVKNAGYELWYEPSCVIYHKESMTVGSSSPLKVRYMVRNRLIYAMRNRKPFYAVVSIAYQLMIAIPKMVLFSLIKGHLSAAMAAVAGANAFLFAKRDIFNSWKRF